MGMIIDRNATALVVVQRRGGWTEAEHAVSVAVVDAYGAPQRGVGSDRPGTWRSAAKPFQLEVSLGLLGNAVFTSPELALGTSSHHGEPGHVAGVRGLLERFALSEAHLFCGSHPPVHEPSANALVRVDAAPTAIHNNCSGKHSFMAAACRAMGWAEDYRDADHPLQVAILESVQRRTGGAVVDRVIDGCGVPCFVLPLSGMARAWAVAAVATRTGDGPLGAVGRAMLAEPWFASGSGAVDGEWMRTARRPMLAKVGAEGLLCVGFPETGLGMAIKVHSGSSLARVVAVRAVMQRWFPEWVPSENSAATTLYNCVGRPCGEVVAEWHTVSAAPP